MSHVFVVSFRLVFFVWSFNIVQFLQLCPMINFVKKYLANTTLFTVFTNINRAICRSRLIYFFQVTEYGSNSNRGSQFDFTTLGTGTCQCGSYSPETSWHTEPRQKVRGPTQTTQGQMDQEVAEVANGLKVNYNFYYTKFQTKFMPCRVGITTLCMSYTCTHALCMP